MRGGQETRVEAPESPPHPGGEGVGGLLLASWLHSIINSLPQRRPVTESGTSQVQQGPRSTQGFLPLHHLPLVTLVGEGGPRRAARSQRRFLVSTDPWDLSVQEEEVTLCICNKLCRKA